MNKRQQKKQMKYRAIDAFIRQAYIQEAEMIERWLESLDYEPTAKDKKELYFKIMEKISVDSTEKDYQMQKKKP